MSRSCATSSRQPAWVREPYRTRSFRTAIILTNLKSLRGSRWTKWWTRKCSPRSMTNLCRWPTSKWKHRKPIVPNTSRWPARGCTHRLICMFTITTTTTITNSITTTTVTSHVWHLWRLPFPNQVRPVNGGRHHHRIPHPVVTPSKDRWSSTDETTRTWKGDGLIIAILAVSICSWLINIFM